MNVEEHQENENKIQKYYWERKKLKDDTHNIDITKLSKWLYIT